MGFRAVEHFDRQEEAYDRLACLAEKGRFARLCAQPDGRFGICYKSIPVMQGKLERLPACQ